MSKSIQKELNHYYKLIQSGDFDIQHVTKGAFTQARAKLEHTAFIELSNLVVDEFYDSAPWMSWNGRRILSIDGSAIALPESPSLKQVYPTHKFGAGERERSMARVSHLYDPLNKIIINASIGPYSESEISLGKKHFDFIESGDVVLLDRYYPSIWLFLVLQNIGADFVVRLKETRWKSAIQLLEGTVNEKTVELQVSKEHLGLLKEYKVEKTKIKCRIIRYTLKNGEKMVLCTSLTDREAHDRQSIFELYGKRWGIEESYKFLKCRLDLENFSGKTPHAILQDFYVKIMLSNLCTMGMLEQEIRLEQEQQKNQPKLKYQLNRSFTISVFKDLPLFMFLKQKLKQALDAFYQLIRKALSPIRPGRSFKRRTSPTKKGKMNYKPI